MDTETKIEETNTNKKEDIVLLRTVGDEFIIGYEVGSDNEITDKKDTVELNEARTIQMSYTNSGKLGLMMIPLMPYSVSHDTTASIPKSVILKKIGEKDIIEKLIKAYQGELSGLDLTTASDVGANNIII